MSDTTKLWHALNQRDEARAIIKKIQDALGTEEEGDALVEIARNAHRAEMALERECDDE